MNELDTSTKSDRWTRYLFRGSLIFTLASALLFGFLELPVEMGLGVTAGALGMAFSSLDKIAWFKGGSFELRTLRKEVEESAATLRTVKSLAAALSRPLLDMIAAEGRYGGSAGAKETTADRITDYLRELGLQESEIREARSEFNTYRLWDHGQHIEWSCRGLTNEQAHALQELKDYKELYLSPPDVYRQKLSELGLLDEQVEEAIKDYEYYIEHKRLRRPEVWLKNRIEGRVHPTPKNPSTPGANQTQKTAHLRAQTHHSACKSVTPLPTPSPSIYLTST